MDSLHNAILELLKTELNEAVRQLIRYAMK
jgi:hypothetical protein